MKNEWAAIIQILIFYSLRIIFDPVKILSVTKYICQNKMTNLFQLSFSRVKLTSEGKIIVKGVKKFDLKERCNVLEIVLAEKITSAKQTESHLKMLTDAVESIKGEKQQAKGLQEYKMMKEAEFDNLEERLQK